MLAVPELVTLDGLIAPQTRPDGTVDTRETVPVKPLIGATVTVEGPAPPVGEVEVRLKSVTANVAVVECETVPLNPVIVTM
jgi:hypothetical protein